jgi:pimeloyl-ACP methyl ester carboxylesterase
MRLRPLLVVAALVVPACHESCSTSDLPSGFPPGFPVAVDTAGLGKGKRIHGFGGSGPVEKTPIVFVHGNGSDEDAFRPVARLLRRDLGYRPSELWSFSLQGYPRRSGEVAATGHNTPHENGVRDLKAMIDAVISFTGAKKVDLLAHSWGVTLGRHYLKKFDAYDRVGTFVAVAGANHGLVNALDAGEPEWTAESINRLCLHASGDETPYGAARDRGAHLAPTSARRIRWIVVHAGRDDYAINTDLKTERRVDNTASPLLSGADATLDLAGAFRELDRTNGSHSYLFSRPGPLFGRLSPYLAAHRGATSE